MCTVGAMATQRGRCAGKLGGQMGGGVGQKWEGEGQSPETVFSNECRGLQTDQPHGRPRRDVWARHGGAVDPVVPYIPSPIRARWRLKHRSTCGALANAGCRWGLSRGLQLGAMDAICRSNRCQGRSPRTAQGPTRAPGGVTWGLEQETVQYVGQGWAGGGREGRLPPRGRQGPWECISHGMAT